jgi:diguanylate cyclase (GGDEF)-like protein/PAS domain S-box-containing protein
MPKASERRARQEQGAGHCGAGTHTSTPQIDQPRGHEGLLEVVWEALNVSRENKALLMASSGTIVNINRLAAELSGASLAGLKGTRVTNLLRAPPSAAMARWETTFEREGMRPIPIEVTRQSLSGAFADVEIYAIRDLRERRATADQLQRQSRLLVQQAEDLKAKNRLLDAALSNMVQGLAMFDAEQRVIVANERFAEMYGQRPEDVVPGTPLRKIIEHRIVSGLYVGTTVDEVLDRMRARVARQKPSHMTATMGDGRTIAVSIQPRPDGGWVTTHQDITEREKLAARLEQQNLLLKTREAELEAQNARFNTTINNMPQGLCLFGVDRRIIIANRRYAEIYGLMPQQVKPGTTLTSVLEARVAAGTYAPEDAQRMVADTIDHFGTRRMQTLNLADGRIISVVRVPMDDGSVISTHEDVTERQKLQSQLERQNDLLKEREEELKNQNARFNTAINNMAQGLCLFDADQRVVFANRQFAELYGLTAEQVKPGTALREILEARAATGLYANIDAERFVREGVETFQEKISSVVRLADGRAISVVRMPMPGGGLVSTHEDITEREKLNAKIVQQHEQLDAALENMLQGVAMFDADQRLIVCNSRYATMYGLTPEQVRPGTTVREIFEHRLANGFYNVTDKDGFVRGWTKSFGEVSSRIQELADGRIISVTRHGMANGGRLVTHEDITERQKLTAQLEAQHGLLKEQEEQLRQQNVRLDAALGNMVQGLAMFDAEYRLVIANEQYALMYGLTPDQLRPGTTLRQILEYRIAAGYCPGRSAEDLLQATLRRMSGKRSTQYVTELHNGRCIAVSAQTMSDGGTVTTHQDITEQRRSEAKIAHMALHDTLTGLPNRVLLNEQLEHAIARSRRGELVAAHLLDLDHFKTVNDTLGHPAGDKLLQMVAERLRPLIRESDTVARMGGDEFAVVQVGIAEPADAASLALRIIDSVGAPYEIDSQLVIIGVSVGIAMCPDDGDSPAQLMRNADLALYRAKGNGRGTFRFFEQEMDAQMQERHALERELRKALAAEQFELHYQPIVDLASNDISGFEALLRWRHPKRGLVPPNTFIPLAEEIGLIVPIGEWVIREACAAAVKWPDDLRVAVNLSPLQFRNPGLLQIVVSALAQTRLAPERLELEITETVLLQDGELTLGTLYRLRELGIRIAMDDFGTGYSSLSYLQSFPFDKIKIDRSFVKDIVESTGSLNIVRAVAALAQGLGITATAEGVETEEQLERIRAEGCKEMQGFLFGAPMPAEDIERVFLTNRRRSQKLG